MKSLLVTLLIAGAGLVGNGFGSSGATVRYTPVLVVGNGASGVAAAVSAARNGAEVTLAGEHPWAGGMLTAAGVSAIDGNKNMPSGSWGEFRDSLVARYGSREALRTGWVSDVQFEPKVGADIFANIIESQPSIDYRVGLRPVSAVRHDGEWTVGFVSDDMPGDTLMFISPVVVDATELGDVAAMAGVGYDIGMESRRLTGEEVGPDESNSIIQDLTYVAVLKDYGRDVTIERPDGYDPDDFACTAWNDRCVTPKEPDRMWPADKMITYGALPNGKYMINWPIEGNDYYVNIIELPHKMRVEALKAAKEFTLRYIYFLQHELGFNHLGLADDEFQTPDRLPYIPYHRESRRIRGLVRYTVTDLSDPYADADRPYYRTYIGVGDYPVDQHHKRYTGDEVLPDLHFHPVPSFGLPMGTLLPADADGLIVAEKSVSVSNIANGATRLQPVVLQIGDAAGTIAAVAAARHISPRDVSVREVQSRLLDRGTYLMPYIDVDRTSPLFKPLQRIGASGLLRGESRRVGWTNETLIHPDSLLHQSDLKLLADFYGVDYTPRNPDEPVYRSDIESVVVRLAPRVPGLDIYGAYSKANDAIRRAGLTMPTHRQPITRGIYAVVVDALFNPFGREVDINGQLL